MITASGLHNGTARPAFMHVLSHLLPPTWSPQDGTLLDLPSENILYDDLENWLDTGRRLAKTAMQDRLLFHFAIGDWYNCGVASLGSRAEKAAKALPHISYAAIRQCAYVAKRFPTDFRTIELPWNLYRQLAPEPAEVRFPFLNQVLSGTLEEEEWQGQLKQMSRLRRLSSRSASESRVRLRGRSAAGHSARGFSPCATQPEEPLNLRQCLTPSESRVGAGRHLAERHPAPDLGPCAPIGPTAVDGPCAPAQAPNPHDLPANLRQCLTPSPAPCLHELVKWIRSNYTSEERLQLIKLLLAQAPQQVKDKLAVELIGTADKPCLLRISRERWADWEFLSDQVDEDIGIVATRLMYHADRVYGPYVRRRRISLRDGPAP